MDIGTKINDLEIIDYSHQGLGIGKIENHIIFVPNCIVGEIVNIVIDKKVKKIYYGKIIEIVKKSKNRTNYICEHYNQCGGCNIAHLNYEEQLKFKTNTLIRNLQKNKIKINPETIISNENQLQYRNKITFKFIEESNKIKLALNQNKNHHLTAIKKCHLINDDMNKIALLFTEYMNEVEEKIYNYNDIKQKTNGNIKQLIVRKNQKNEYMIILISKKGKIKSIEKFIQIINYNKLNVQGIVLYESPDKKVETIGNFKSLLFGQPYLEEQLLNLKFKIHATAFFQINYKQTQKLYQQVIDITDFNNKIVMDAYCGTGTIGLLIAQKAKKVIGVETNIDSIKSANENKTINNINNIEFIHDKVEKSLSYLNKEIDIVVVDPPRSGLHQKFIEELKINQIKEIIYVSCSLATLIRDIKLLEETYKVEKIFNIDIFSQTYHQELVVKLILINK